MDPHEEIEALRARSLLRRLREVRPLGDGRSEVEGRVLINFSSNDYLGLAGDDRLRRAAKEAIDRWGIGSGGSRLICGTSPAHARLEARLAEFERAEAALTFASGYAAALGAVTTLVGRGDAVLLDKLAHASLVDAARLSGATLRVFPHNDLARLERHLAWARERVPDGRVLVITESVFSMDGDRAPLDRIAEIKARHGALLLVDEAHALGVAGPSGSGLARELGVEREIDVRMGTLSKALGVSGGYLCGSADLIALLVNRARSFLYTTAPPPALAAAALAAIDALDSAEGEERRATLWERVRHLHRLVPARLRFGGSAPTGPTSAILPLMIGDEGAAVAASEELARLGFFLPAIRYPTVGRGRARLRAAVSAAHSAGQIEALGDALARLESLNRRSR